MPGCACLSSTSARIGTRPPAQAPPASSTAALARAQHVARLVGIAATHSPIRVACLHRSLVLWWLLRRDGIPCQLRLGAHAGAGQFEAHAWVQCAGVALEQRPAHGARYSPSTKPSCRWSAQRFGDSRRDVRVIGPWRRRQQTGLRHRSVNGRRLGHAPTRVMAIKRRAGEHGDPGRAPASITSTP